MTIRTDCKNIVQISTYSEITFISPLVTYQYLFSNQASGATTGGNGGSRLRAPLERGRRVQTAMFFF